MRGNIALRVLVAAGVILLTYLGMFVIAWGIQVPEVVLPKWSVKELPIQLGEWKGTDKKLDERLFLAEEANSAVEREYRNEETGMVIALHLAFFTDPNKGIWHNPITCYQSNGWLNTATTKVPFSETDENSDKVRICSWDKKGEKTVIAYWYQLGDHRLYGRWDLGWNVRWQMRGRKTWPALIKVLLSTPDSMKPEETRARLVSFAGLVHQWINQPQHQDKEESTATKPAAAE